MRNLNKGRYIINKFENVKNLNFLVSSPLYKRAGFNKKMIVTSKSLLSKAGGEKILIPGL